MNTSSLCRGARWWEATRCYGTSESQCRFRLVLLALMDMNEQLGESAKPINYIERPGPLICGAARVERLPSFVLMCVMSRRASPVVTTLLGMFRHGCVKDSVV